ncbi:hypothetical protein [Nocardia sp. NPDC005366]|uniref:hypothetical protein n=1 Tax=Nocardia sp. NPDC005366 TaxID=3156878 RepID=UPI0033AD4660
MSSERAVAAIDGREGSGVLSSNYPHLVAEQLGVTTFRDLWGARPALIWPVASPISSVVVSPSSMR